ncbi:helix-turn-helix domain-containing protein [Chryseobacterium binzhouense]|uniref:helix-turn-helix domain-containing protein n=1 Tax=Chryseobacterium binzhouense TaxID=2593646 RepID=UPI00289972B0|nr:helix-turn-helix transcriptional regulator [Chryseobacterium binzhouense]
MPEAIKKLQFKSISEGASLQIECALLQELVKTQKKTLVTPHRTNFYHIFLFENCHTTHIIDFEPYVIEPYSLLFIDKDRVHQFHELLQYEGELLIFTDHFFCVTDADAAFLRSSIVFDYLVDEPLIRLNKEAFKKFKKIIEEIKEELRLPLDTAQPIFLKNLVHNFLILAEREKRKQGFSDVKKGTDLDYTLLFRDVLEMNYNQLKTVSEYASSLFISEKRLGQATAKVLGKTPKEMINDRILLEAKRLLVYTHLSIKEIGQNLGFDDPAYFVRYFKKNTTTTPLEFRATQLKN